MNIMREIAEEVANTNLFLVKASGSRSEGFSFVIQAVMNQQRINITEEQFKRFAAHKNCVHVSVPKVRYV